MARPKGPPGRTLAKVFAWLLVVAGLGLAANLFVAYGISRVHHPNAPLNALMFALMLAAAALAPASGYVLVLMRRRPEGRISRHLAAIPVAAALAGLAGWAAAPTPPETWPQHVGDARYDVPSRWTPLARVQPPGTAVVIRYCMAGPSAVYGRGLFDAGCTHGEASLRAPEEFPPPAFPLDELEPLEAPGWSARRNSSGERDLFVQRDPAGRILRWGRCEAVPSPPHCRIRARARLGAFTYEFRADDALDPESWLEMEDALLARIESWRAPD